MTKRSRLPILRVVFYQTATGAEPVREWLKSLPRPARKVIGEDIKTAQFGWPIGMPLIRKLEPRLWEVRSTLNNGTARVIFTVHDQTLVLPHGFMKKQQQTPRGELQFGPPAAGGLAPGVKL